MSETGYRYPSRRMLTVAANGMVGTSQGLASQAGLEMLKRGGNAVDAAIAAAAVLVVVEPTSNGFGGDAFAQVWMNGKLYALNSSGVAPRLLSAGAIREKCNVDAVPRYGWESVTVPGLPKAWSALWKRFGQLPFEDLLQPAIDYAEQGFAVTPVIAHNWKRDFDRYERDLGGEKEGLFAGLYDAFTDDGRTPEMGEIFRYKYHGTTLRELAETKCESFYSGRLARRMDEFSRRTGGYLRLADLEGYEAEWVEPVKVNYRGYDIYELPPNGHGLVALMALNILNNFSLQDKDKTETYHTIIEAVKLAYEDGKKYIADPRYMSVSVEELLDRQYARERADLVTDRAMLPKAGNPQKGGTVYLCTADREGNMVSLIQSNYQDFGSGVVVPGTGIAFHNRGCNFSLDEMKGNYLMPGKKPYHTIIPGFITKDGRAIGPFGVMGDFMQPQGHVQVVTNMIDFKLNPQQALDAPRWRWREGRTVEVESNFPGDIAAELSARGHEIVPVDESAGFGRGQIIVRNDNGTYFGGTEPRADGAMAGY